MMLTMCHRRLLCVVAFLALLFTVACKQPQQPTPGPAAPEPATIDKEKLCSEGGAVFNAGNNACECPGERSWDGTKCIASADQAQDQSNKEKQLCVDEGGIWENGDCTCTNDRRWKGKRCLQNDSDDFSWEKVVESCKAAGGKWDRDQRYCACSGSKVLTDERCAHVTNGLTRSVCEDAVFPGQWLKNLCICPEEEDWFNTSRGGCVPAQKDADEEILEAICESSVNKGKWDKGADRCTCPSGRVWFQESCPEQSDLSSREVCEGDFNKGVWSTDDKICHCPVGSMWVDQTCKDLTNLSERQACVSDFNGGEWSVAPGNGTCLCPDGKGWLASVKRCDDDAVSGAQQLCLQSGGQPSAGEGTCNCPTGMKVEVLAPKNYQYCVRNEGGADVPVWLLILLGLMEA